jgi:Peptidase family M23
MRRHRTTARGMFLALLCAGLLAVLASPAGGGGSSAKGVPRLVFPLVAKTELWDNYGDPRGNGRHAGIDMENPWRAPVVAVEPGRVKYWDSSLGGCMLYLYGQSGTTYMYIHLNNDLTPKNDNRGGCVQDVAFSVPNGARVSAGQQIGWNGDSGDAAGNPHLHFEVHPGGGGDVNPYRFLKSAVKPLFAAKLGSRFSLGLSGEVASVAREVVQLDIERVRHYPGGRWLEIGERRVALAATPEALAPIMANGDLIVAAGGALKPRTPVLAFTPKARTTQAALLGSAGALKLQRVVRR